MTNPTNTQSWKNLISLAVKTHKSADIQVGGGALDITMDFSKSFISDDVWAQLLALAGNQNIAQWRDKMVAMESINFTENRAVGHIQLRSNTRDDVGDVLNRMQSYCDGIHAKGAFTDIVHIGIGGSDLGPRLVCDALKHLPKKMNVHFVANIDGADVAQALAPLNPQTTLICIASKTFTTQETMMNAAYAKTWLGDLDVAEHMIALSTNSDAVSEFGIDTANMFPFWDWVGGRFSVWAAIGMPIALAYGFDVFQAFLNGAKTMDNHFCKAEMDENLPILLALYGVWNRNFMNRPALAVLPYAQSLSLLSNFLQQLDMESNGKSVDRDGNFITDYKTGPIVFGQAGTNGQHAFHQWLHQGTDIVPCEFITVEDSPYDANHHRVLNAHAGAQAKAFATGQNHDNPHQYYGGQRPSVTLKMRDLSASSLGQLIALYEHKIFVQGIIWNINSFDQYGVELGKAMAKEILAQ
jgi:glucose-6-phosphate isomerase